MNRTAKLAIAVLGSLVLMVAGAVAYAAIPSSTGVFTACVQKSSGAVRFIDTEVTPARTCSSTEQRVSWNQQGQPGTNGTNGTNGVSGYEKVDNSGTHEFVGSDRTVEFFVIARCPEGKVAVGGGGIGFIRNDDGSDGRTANLVGSYPVSGDDDRQWDVGFSTADGSAFTDDERLNYSVYAICVTAS